MNAEYLLLCIFPAIMLILMLIKIKIAPKGKIHEDFISLEQSKVLRGLAAMGIVIHHLVQYVTDYGATLKGPISFFIFTGILFTSIFFFFSGFGLITSLQKKPNYLKTFFEGRFLSVFVPFMVSNFIYTVMLGLYFGSIQSVVEMAVSLLGFKLLNTNTWFLIEILILYLAFYFIFRFVKDSKKALKYMSIFVIGMIFISFLLGHDNSGGSGSWFRGEWWYNTTVFFLAGMYVAKYYGKIVAFLKKHYKWMLPVSIVLFVLLFFGEIIVLSYLGYYREWTGHPGYGSKAVTLLYETLFCAVWLLMIFLISMKVQIKNVVLLLLSEISLEIYIIHELVKVFLIYGGQTGSVEIFLWVFIGSIAFALPLRFISNFIIIILTERDRPITSESDMTPERKILIKEQKRKKRKFLRYLKIAVVFVIILCIGELYLKYVQPYVYYKQELEVLSTAEIGDEVFFGTLDYDYETLGVDRIKWYVADRQGDEVLLVCTNIVEGSSFHNAFEPACWTDSSLRVRLNEFYLEVINKYEQELVILSVLENDANSEYGTVWEDSTQDYMFILSAEEIELYFENPSERKMTPTPAAIINGINYNIRSGVNWQERDGQSWWWVRTMGEDELKVAFVNEEGIIEYDGRYCTVGRGGVRPAMWVKCTVEEEQ